MTPAPPYVRANEAMVWMGRPTLRALASQAIGSLVAVLLLGSIILNGLGDGAVLMAPVVVGLLLAGLLALLTLHALRLRRTEFVLTDQGVYTRTGLIGQSVSQTTFDKITDIALKQDVLGRLFGYATLQINTAGSNLAAVQMVGLTDALETKQRIEAARERSLGGGSGSADRPPPGARVSTFVLAEHVMTVRCPTTKALFKRPRSETGHRIVCPKCSRSHVVKEA